MSYRRLGAVVLLLVASSAFGYDINFPPTAVGSTIVGQCFAICFTGAGFCGGSGTITLDESLASPFWVRNLRRHHGPINTLADCTGTPVRFPVDLTSGEVLLFDFAFSPTSAGTFTDEQHNGDFVWRLSGAADGPKPGSSITDFCPIGTCYGPYSISITSQESCVTPGGLVHAEVTLRNEGSTQPHTGVMGVCLEQPGTTIQSFDADSGPVTWGCTTLPGGCVSNGRQVQGQSLLCSYTTPGSWPTNQSRVRLTARVPNGLAGRFRATALANGINDAFQVSFSRAQQLTLDACCATPTQPTLTIEKRAHLPGDPATLTDIQPGQLFEYQIDVRNNCVLSSIGTITVTDQIPAELEIVSVRPESCQVNARVVTCATNLPLVPNGPPFTIAIYAKLPETSAFRGEITNLARLSGGGDPTTPKNSNISSLFAVNGSTAPCDTANPDSLCLNGGRFEVQGGWEVASSGASGRARATSLGPETGSFWFFDPSNVELTLKVLDGRPINGKFWVLYGALSDVAYTIRIRDANTGATRSYFNPQGRQASVADTGAFSNSGTSAIDQSIMTARDAADIATTSWAPTAACIPGTTALCLAGGRFKVEVTWKTPSASGVGSAIPSGPDTGYFWFFGSSNIELIVKMLDGRPINGKFWLFYGALSNVEYTLKVTDTQTGVVKTYKNPQNQLASFADTQAF
jgi:hypothetical protein